MKGKILLKSMVDSDFVFFEVLLRRCKDGRAPF